MPRIRIRRIRPTRAGLKRRRTFRVNKVKQSISNLDIGATDKEALTSLLTKDVQTKRGFERSKKLESAIFSGDIKRVKRFKEFWKLKSGELSNVIRQLKSDADFYNKNRELILEFNQISKKEKENRRNATRLRLETEHFNYLNQKEKRR